MPRKLACGALAGSISQTITYPMDVLRRKMQVSGMSSLGVSHSSAIDALRYILKTDGVKGLYKGLWPNLREYLYRNLVGLGGIYANKNFISIFS